MSVPQFGDWDQKGPLPDYSMDFSKIRQNRKQNKRDISRASIGNEEDLISSNTVKLNTTNNSAPHHSYGEDHHSPTFLFMATDSDINEEKDYELLQLLRESVKDGCCL
ncbi:hypothetical protein Tco_1482511 [Tanacetum coccineum]